jgi:glycosyltransferase involved in cell wall biosynthesis
MPFPPIDGGAQLIHNTTTGLLANGVMLKTLAINPSRNYVDPASLPPEYLAATGFEALRVDTGINAAGLAQNLFSKASYFVSRFASADFAGKIAEVLQAREYDIVQLEHLYLCRYIQTIRKFSKAKIVLRPQNVEYVIWERYLGLVKNPMKKFFLQTAISRLKEFERGVRETLDGILPVTRDDAAIFSSFPGNCPVQVVTMGYDQASLADYDFERQYTVPPVFYHLGSMDWLPNVEAVRWFLEMVWPLLEGRRQRAEGGSEVVKGIIAGRKMPGWVYRYDTDRLAVLGEVTKPLPFQEDKPVMIVPLWSGSGIRAKIIEGMALGKTIISTGIGAQGIDCEHGKNILIANTPEEFADAIIRCLNSPETCRRIGENARKLSLQKYDHILNAKHMISFYHEILYHHG